MLARIAAFVWLATHTPLAATTDDAGKELLRSAAAACKQVSSVRYSVVQHVGAHTVTADIVQQRADVPDAGQGGGKYCAQGRVTDDDGTVTRFAWSYDGQTLRVLDMDNKFVAVVDNPDAGDAGRMIGAGTGLVAFVQFMDGDGFLRMLEKADRIDAKGNKEVGGTACDLVEIDQSFAPPGEETKAKTTSTWAFARADHLPRSFAARSLTREITKLELNPKLAADFTFEAPQGFEERRILRHDADTRGLLALGTEAPAWKLTGADGKEVSLADLKGKVVVLDFWATWCQPCRRAMPGIQQISTKYPPAQVVVYGISTTEKEGADPGAFLKEHKFTYPALLHGETISAAYKAASLPTVYIIDQGGKIIHAEKGFREGADAQFAEVIDKALKAKGSRY